MVEKTKNSSANFQPKNRNEWRQWLIKNHEVKQSVWLTLYKKNSGKPTINWSEAVDEALCFGWIDSTRKSVDEESFIQFFTRRKPTGTWSKINKEKVRELTALGLMTTAGLKSIELAKQNGSWNILDSVEEMEIPKELSIAFKNHAGSQEYFMGLSKSVRKSILQWVVLAKRAETRQKRITEIAEQAAKRLKPKHLS